MASQFPCESPAQKWVKGHQASGMQAYLHHRGLGPPQRKWPSPRSLSLGVEMLRGSHRQDHSPRAARGGLCRHPSPAAGNTLDLLSVFRALLLWFWETRVTPSLPQNPRDTTGQAPPPLLPGPHRGGHCMDRAAAVLPGDPQSHQQRGIRGSDETLSQCCLPAAGARDGGSRCLCLY